jgi:hypothetical protein
VTIPDAAQSHPIWKIVEDPAKNRAVLAAMPEFGGTNYMQRLKPAATTLGMSATPIPQAGIMPIFACQTYGRGRTFAFAPDTTADWGKWFESQWGEGGDNRYFRRFWRNVIRWLTENSTGGNKRLLVETDRVIYRDGQPIQITARALDEHYKETIDYQLSATVRSVPAAATSLVPTAQGTAYTGQMETSPLAAVVASDAAAVLADNEIDVVATHKGKEIARATARVMVLPDLHELVQPRAQPEVLDRLASDTGGSTLRSTGDLTALLQGMRATRGNSLISRQPLWDHTALWTVIIILLGIEWSLRRLSGFG